MLMSLNRVLLVTERSIHLILKKDRAFLGLFRFFPEHIRVAASSEKPPLLVEIRSEQASPGRGLLYPAPVTSQPARRELYGVTLIPRHPRYPGKDRS